MAASDLDVATTGRFDADAKAAVTNLLEQYTLGTPIDDLALAIIGDILELLGVEQ